MDTTTPPPNARAVAANRAFSHHAVSHHPTSISLADNGIPAIVKCVVKDSQIAIPINGKLWLYTFCHEFPMAETVVALVTHASESSAIIYRPLPDGTSLFLGIANRYATDSL
jgi:hypothetical protein